MKFYRYIAEQNVTIILFKDFYNIELRLLEYNLFKETPKGYWIKHKSDLWLDHDWKKWIPKTSKKRFAYPTKKEALVNYMRRTESRISHLEHQIGVSKEGYAQAKKLMNEFNNGK